MCIGRGFIVKKASSFLLLFTKEKKICGRAQGLYYNVIPKNYNLHKFNMIILSLVVAKVAKS